MTDVYICDGIRTPVGRYGGSLSTIRTDDLAAIPIAALMGRNPGVDWAAVDDVILGCANQAGEDNRNVARMSSLLAGLPQDVPACTINRLCGSGLNAVGSCANAIRSGEGELMIAGGVLAAAEPSAGGSITLRVYRVDETGLKQFAGATVGGGGTVNDIAVLESRNTVLVAGRPAFAWRYRN